MKMPLKNAAMPSSWINKGQRRGKARQEDQGSSSQAEK